MLITPCLLALLAVPVPGTLAVGGVQTPAPQGLTLAQRRWSRSAGGTSTQIALGEHGTQAAMISYGAQLELLSSFDQHPPEPVWVSPGNWSLGPLASASARDLVFLSAAEVVGGSSLVSTLRCYRSSAPEPLWSLTLQPQFFAVPFVGVSRDGQVLVSLLDDDDTVEHQIRVHDPDTGAVTAYFTAPIETYTVRFALAPDGNVLAHSHYDGTGFTTLRGVASGAILLHTPGSLPDERALSHDGRVIITRQRVIGQSWTVRVQVQSAGVWSTVVEETTPLDVPPLDMAVSADGSMAAAGWRDPAKPFELLIRAWDVATGALVFERTPGATVAPGFQTYENYLTDLAFSADGSRLAAGSWGTGPQGPAELVVWDVPGDTQAAAFPTLGSVMALDLSADGQRLLVQRLGKHNHRGSNPSYVELYDVGGADLAIDGVPRLDGTLTISLSGKPGSSAWLLLAAGLLPVPIQAGLAGLLALDPSNLLLLPAGVVEANGVASLALAVPPLPALVGLALHTQGASGSPLALGHDTVALTLLP